MKIHERIFAPEEAMQSDLVPELHPSIGYENIVTAKDVFSRFLFTYPTSNQDAKAIAKVNFNIMTKHASLPTTLLSDKRTASTSHVIKETTRRPGYFLKHAITKHAQTIGMFERTPVSIIQALKVKTGGRKLL